MLKVFPTLTVLCRTFFCQVSRCWSFAVRIETVAVDFFSWKYSPHELWQSGFCSVAFLCQIFCWEDFYTPTFNCQTCCSWAFHCQTFCYNTNCRLPFCRWNCFIRTFYSEAFCSWTFLNLIDSELLLTIRNFVLKIYVGLSSSAFWLIVLPIFLAFVLLAIIFFFFLLCDFSPYVFLCNSFHIGLFFAGGFVK